MVVSEQYADPFALLGIRRPGAVVHLGTLQSGSQAAIQFAGQVTNTGNVTFNGVVWLEALYSGTGNLLRASPDLTVSVGVGAVASITRVVDVFETDPPGDIYVIAYLSDLGKGTIFDQVPSGNLVNIEAITNASFGNTTFGVTIS